MCKFKLISFLGLITAAFFFSCKKDYYVDSSVHTGVYNGSTMQFLESRKDYFDTTVLVIKLAGMEDVFKNEKITFFAPTSSSIYKTVKALNTYLRLSSRDTVSDYSQIDASVWRKNLSQYVFKGVSKLKDYPQLDTLAYAAYPGQSYNSYDGQIMNVGVLYNDAVSNDTRIPYAGYRQLYLSLIKDFTQPQQSLVNVPVATSDLQTSNGVVHVLAQSQAYSNGTYVNRHNFGFVMSTFIQDAITAGIAPKP